MVSILKAGIDVGNEGREVKERIHMTSLLAKRVAIVFLVSLSQSLHLQKWGRIIKLVAIVEICYDK